MLRRTRQIVMVVLAGCVALLVWELPRALAASGAWGGFSFYAIVYLLPALVVVVAGFLLMRHGSGVGRLAAWGIATIAVAWWLGLVDPDLVQMAIRGQTISIDPVSDPLTLVPSLLIVAALGGFLIAILRPREEAA